MRAHILRPSPKVICVVVGFFQHLVRPEIGMEKATGEADPRLGCVGRETRKQMLMQTGEVKAVVQKRTEVKLGWSAQMGGWGSQWSERVDVMGGREETEARQSWSEV